MKIIIDIHEQDYVYIAKKHCLPSCDDKTLRKKFYEMIAKGLPLDESRDSIDVLDKIKTEIERLPITDTAVRLVTEIIDKYGDVIEYYPKDKEEGDD